MKVHNHRRELSQRRKPPNNVVLVSSVSLDQYVTSEKAGSMFPAFGVCDAR